MDANGFMERNGLTEEAVEWIARDLEDGDVDVEGAPGPRSGSHLDAVGKRRVTVVYDAAATQRVAAIARARGVTPSAVYREALAAYLASL